jgi:hypothetical protein
MIIGNLLDRQGPEPRPTITGPLGVLERGQGTLDFVAHDDDELARGTGKPFGFQPGMSRLFAVEAGWMAGLRRWVMQASGFFTHLAIGPTLKA